jgi:hypothetical protein
MKKIANHQLFAYNTHLVGPEEAKWPERKIRSNMSIQSHVKPTTTPRVAKPRIKRYGDAARILVLNSRILILLLKAWRWVITFQVQITANKDGRKDRYRMALSCTLLP